MENNVRLIDGHEGRIGRNGKTIRAVLFDVDGTLYRQRPVRIRMALELLLLVSQNPAKGYQTIRILWSFRQHLEKFRGSREGPNLLKELLLQSVAKNTGYPLFEVHNTVSEWFFCRPLPYLSKHQRPGLASFLAWCETNAIHVGAFSDYPTRKKIKALELDRSFNLHVCAMDAEVNAFKPSPKGIILACRRWQLDPSEVVYVGDRPEVDGQAAQTAGTHFVLVGGTRRHGLVSIADFRELIGFSAFERPGRDYGH